MFTLNLQTVNNTWKFHAGDLLYIIYLYKASFSGTQSFKRTVVSFMLWWVQRKVSLTKCGDTSLDTSNHQSS